MMTIKDIYVAINKISPVHYDTIVKILRRKRRPSPELAKNLEKVTNIPRLAWLYPDEYYNPLIAQYSKKEKQNKSKKEQKLDNG